jgi:hypothetical protein
LKIKEVTELRSMIGRALATEDERAFHVLTGVIARKLAGLSLYIYADLIKGTMVVSEARRRLTQTDELLQTLEVVE